LTIAILRDGCVGLHCAVDEDTVVDASSVGTIEGAAAGSMTTVRVDVDVRPFWSVTTESMVPVQMIRRTVGAGCGPETPRYTGEIRAAE